MTRAFCLLAYVAGGVVVYRAPAEPSEALAMLQEAERAAPHNAYAIAVLHPASDAPRPKLDVSA